jgi:excisionase family DNA binding protein
MVTFMWASADEGGFRALLAHNTGNNIMSPTADNEAITITNRVAPPIVYSVAEACAIARMGRASFYKAINTGKLKAIKHGRRTLVFTAELQRWLSELPEMEANVNAEDAAPPTGVARKRRRVS